MEEEINHPDLELCPSKHNPSRKASKTSINPTRGQRGRLKTVQKKENCGPAKEVVPPKNERPFNLLPDGLFESSLMDNKSGHHTSSGS